MVEQSLRPRSWIVLGLVLGTILLLILLVEVFSFSESRHLQDDIHRLVRNAERSTYLIGDIGHRLSRLHTNVLEALTEAPAETDQVLKRVSSIEEDLHRHLEELPNLLSSEELSLWRDVEPATVAFRDTLSSALRLMQEGRTAEAELELDDLASRSRQLFDSLQSFLEFNQRETRAMVAGADRLLVRARGLQLAVAVLLFTAIAAIALVALRVLRRKERELDLHLQRIENANRDLEAFAGRIAHDLRNVLDPLQSAAHVLTLAATDPDTVTETAVRIERVTRRAGDMLTSLLAFARAGSPPTSTQSRLDDELEAVLEELAPLMERVGAEIELETQPFLVVNCDPALLHVLLLNLLSNAFKFMVDRPVRRVRVDMRAEGGFCVVQVEDTGPGIPRTALGRIFDPFFRAPGVPASGTGIGLATVRRIVEAHGGRIDVSSVEGEGTRFRVLLPRARTREDHPVPETRPHREPAAAGGEREYP